jgi:hypothetical protein
MVADLMNRLELRTAERNDAQAAANAAEARAKVTEAPSQHGQAAEGHVDVICNAQQSAPR